MGMVIFYVISKYVAIFMPCFLWIVLEVNYRNPPQRPLFLSTALEVNYGEVSENPNINIMVWESFKTFRLRQNLCFYFYKKVLTSITLKVSYRRFRKNRKEFL